MTDLEEKKVGLSAQKLVLVGLLLSLVVLAWTLDSFLNPVIKSTDLNIMATIVAKDMDASLFSRDHLFSNDKLYRLYTPLYRWIVAQAWQLGGSFEWGLALLVPPVLGLYLVGMFILFWRVTHHLGLSLVLTLISGHYHDLTMGAEVWGIGGSTEMMSRALFMPLVPFIMLIFWQVCEQPGWFKGSIIGLCLGLGANLHPVSAFHLLALLMMGFILIYGFRHWQTAIAIVVSAVVGAWPVSANYLGNSGQPVDPQLTFEAFSQVVMQRYPLPFFPSTFSWPLFHLQLTRPTLDGLVWLYLLGALFLLGWYLAGRSRWPGWDRWIWLVGGSFTLFYAFMIMLFKAPFLFIIAEGYLIYRFWRRDYARLDGWLVVFTGLIVLYAFVGYYLLTLFWQTFEVWSLTSLLIEYARAARFVYLPLYLLAGLAGVAWLGALRNYLGWERFQPGRWATASLIFIFILSLFGPLAPFFAGYLPWPTRNLLAPRGLEAQPYSNEVDTALYNWAQQNSAHEALFYGCFGPETMTYFRRKAQRSITHNWKDLTFAIHHRATAIQAFDRFRELEAACKSFDRLLQTAQATGADYLLVGRHEAQSYLQEACFVNERYAVFALGSNSCAARVLSDKK